MSGRAEDVYCTLLMSDSYLPGAAVLAKSLRDNGTTKKLAALVTPDSLLPSTLTELKGIYDYVLPVDRLANPNLENLARLDRLDLRFAFTKIALWRQIQFRKIVYLDADVVALRAPDELFNLEAPFAAAPDIGWPDCFNSGVMVLAPSMSEYWSLHTLASSGTSFDGADQGLLNEYFGNRPWHRLSFTYNCTPNASYQYEPAYRHYRSSINMVHFIGKSKPWMEGRQALTAGSGGIYKELLGKWWSTYDRHYRTAESSAVEQPVPGIRAVQQYVKGEENQSANGWAASGQLRGHQPPPPTPSNPPPPPEAPAASTEPPMTDAHEEAESLDQGLTEPIATSQQRKFSAPHNEWDATRAAPPSTAGPEASNFPSTRYEMSRDRGLFRAPPHPEPPRNMYYSVPSTRPGQDSPPKAIFPWEGHIPTATRIFAEDEPAPSSQQPREETTPPSDQNPPNPSITLTPTEAATPSDPWKSFARTNAWDDNTSITNYIRTFKHLQQLQLRQQQRGGVQVLHQDPETPDTAIADFATGARSPSHQQQEEGTTQEPGEKRSGKRRESLILTDFPDASDRPSLPVTPAPIHRTTFWGAERDSAGNLPAAKGVPEQEEWDPREALEGLRRTSLLKAEEVAAAARAAGVSEVGGAAVGEAEGGEEMSSREIIESSVPTQGEVEHRTGEPVNLGLEETLSPTSTSTAEQAWRERPNVDTQRAGMVGPLDEYSIA